MLKVEQINEKKWKRRRKAARLERGSPSYQFQPALLRLSVGSETLPLPSKHMKDGLQITVNQPQSVPARPCLTSLHSNDFHTALLKHSLSLYSSCTLADIIVWPLIFLWKSGKHSTLMNAQNGCLEGGGKKCESCVHLTLSITKLLLWFLRSVVTEGCLQSVWSSNADDDDRIHGKKMLQLKASLM